MNREKNIAALIEKNRIALLRMVFCWLAAAYALNVRSDKPLPRRLSVSAWIEDLIGTAEKATAYLLMAIFYQSQIKKRFSPPFEKAAMTFAMSNRGITLGALTIAGVIKRLKALQHLLHNLLAFARRIAKRLVALTRISVIKIVLQAIAHAQHVTRQEDLIPP